MKLLLKKDKILIEYSLLFKEQLIFKIKIANKFKK